MLKPSWELLGFNGKSLSPAPGAFWALGVTEIQQEHKGVTFDRCAGGRWADLTTYSTKAKQTLYFYFESCGFFLFLQANPIISPAL